MKSSDSFRPTRQAAFRRIGGKVVIVHTLEDRLITLNETGSFIWERLEGCRLDDVIEEMAAEFDVTAEAARADAVEFVEEMISRGLVEKVP